MERKIIMNLLLPMKLAALYDGQELDRKELEELKQYLVSLEDTPEKSRKESRLWKKDTEK